MDHDEFIQYIKKEVPEEELDSIEDRLGTGPLNIPITPRSASGQKSDFLVKNPGQNPDRNPQNGGVTWIPRPDNPMSAAQHFPAPRYLSRH